MAKCTFTLSRECAIITNAGTAGGRVNISLHNCTFSSNNGVLRNEKFAKPTTIISISDSLFMYTRGASAIAVNNVAVIKIQRSLFLSCKSDSGAVSASYSSAFIENSTFESNTVNGSGNLNFAESNLTISN